MIINQKKTGSLLLELLVVIGVIAIITPIIAQVIMVSLSASKQSLEKKTAADLADETVKAVESAAFEKWQNLYDKAKSAGSHYYPVKASGAWVISNGEELVSVNGLEYTRYFTVSNVCRGNLDKAIVYQADFLACPEGSHVDPSTQKITINISWRNGSFFRAHYLTRWRNQICNQTDWGFISAATSSCPSVNYGSATDIDTDSLPGSLILQAN